MLKASGSISCAMHVVYAALSGALELESPTYWQGFGLTEFEIIPGKITEDTSDGSCGLDDLHWSEREVAFRTHAGAMARVGLSNSGGITAFSGWYPTSLKYRPVVEVTQPEDLDENTWTGIVRVATTDRHPTGKAYVQLGEWVRVDGNTLKTIFEERLDK